ncbi:MAG TPA: hypothetical protein VET88_06900 [Gammaproteobacteria bacterium]|nr:hypothetical protein [Gammaproteobacteria bacterium]
MCTHVRCPLALSPVCSVLSLVFTAETQPAAVVEPVDGSRIKRGHTPAGLAGDGTSAGGAGFPA